MITSKNDTATILCPYKYKHVCESMKVSLTTNCFVFA